MILSGALLLLTPPAFAELSAEDIEKISVIIKTEVSASETRIKEYISQEVNTLNVKIDEMDKRLTGEIKGMDKRLTGEISNMDKRLTGEISNMDKRLDQTFTLVVVLITAVIAVVGVPMTIILFQLSTEDKKQRSQDEKIEAYSKNWQSGTKGALSRRSEERYDEKNLRASW